MNEWMNELTWNIVCSVWANALADGNPTDKADREFSAFFCVFFVCFQFGRVTTIRCWIWQPLLNQLNTANKSKSMQINANQCKWHERCGRRVLICWLVSICAAAVNHRKWLLKNQKNVIIRCPDQLFMKWAVHGQTARNRRRHATLRRLATSSTSMRTSKWHHTSQFYLENSVMVIISTGTCLMNSVNPLGT